MYSNNRLFPQDFARRAQFHRQLLPSPEVGLGPQVIQFNFFGQETKLPNLLSHLNLPAENESDKDSDFDLSNFLDFDPHCTFRPNVFAHDPNAPFRGSNENPVGGAGATGYPADQEEPNTQRKAREHCGKNYSRIPPSSGARLNIRQSNQGLPGMIFGEPNLPFNTQKDDAQFLENFQMDFLPSNIENRHEDPEKLDARRRNRNEQELVTNNALNAPAYQTNPQYGRGGNLVSSIAHNAKNRSNNEDSDSQTNVIIGEQIRAPVVRQSYAKIVPKYDLTNCRYCRVAKQPYDHPLYDEAGDVVCAKLSQYKCPFCNATGKKAHTLKYCIENPITRGIPAEIKKLGKGKAPEEHRDEAFRLKKRKLKCRYCKKLNLDSNHAFKDLEGVACPILSKVVCELCKATGKKAHSKEYCKVAKGEVQPGNSVPAPTAPPVVCGDAAPTAPPVVYGDAAPTAPPVVYGDAAPTAPPLVYGVDGNSVETTQVLPCQASTEPPSVPENSSLPSVPEEQESPESTVQILSGSSPAETAEQLAESLLNMDALPRLEAEDNSVACVSVVTLPVIETGSIQSFPKAAVGKLFSEGRAVTEVPSTLGEAVIEVPSTLGEAVTEVPPTLGEAVTEVPSTLGEAVTEVPSTLGEAVTEVPSTLGEAVTEVPSTLGEAVTEVPSTLGEAVTEVPSKLRKAVTEVPSKLEEAVIDELASITVALYHSPCKLEIVKEYSVMNEINYKRYRATPSEIIGVGEVDEYCFPCIASKIARPEDMESCWDENKDLSEFKSECISGSVRTPWILGGTYEL